MCRKPGEGHENRFHGAHSRCSRFLGQHRFAVLERTVAGFDSVLSATGWVCLAKNWLSCAVLFLPCSHAEIIRPALLGDGVREDRRLVVHTAGIPVGREMPH